MYVKGASYTIYDLNLKEVNKLIGCDFSKGEKFETEKDEGFLKIIP